MHLYIHIPFCRQACHYCDFHFSTNVSRKREMVEAIARELELRADYLPDKQLSTIYFGGGTPSLLTREELDILIDRTARHFSIAPDAEITLEANPDNLTREKLDDLKSAGINRLSIGLQSFNEQHLQYLNRVHTRDESIHCVKAAQDAGIDNISIDLIYAIPAPDHSILESDIEKAVSLQVAHISAYCLTIEPQTAFGKWLEKKKIQPIDEEFAAQQFEILTERLRQNGYEQYEISNFARNEHYSRHNTSYWQQYPYLGIGPSAHSYNGVSREYNVANNSAYLAAILKGAVPATVEQLSFVEQTNEYILTGLRTKWGVDAQVLEGLSKQRFEAENQRTLQQYSREGLLSLTDGRIVLTQAGRLFADRIAADLFIE